MRCTRLALLLPVLASCGSDVTVGQRVNLEPTAAILGPEPGLPYVDDELINFRGVVSDPNGLDDPLQDDLMEDDLMEEEDL